MVQKLIRKHATQGYVDYRDSYSLSADIGKLLDTGYDLVGKKNFKDAFSLAKPALKETMEVLAYADDSSGCIGEAVYSAIRLIETISASDEVAIDLQEQVFSFLQTALGHKIYFDYGDFGYDMFTVFQGLAVKLGKAEEFLHFADTQASQLTGEYEGYRRDFFRTQKIDFMEATGRTEEAEKLTHENLDIVEIRQDEVSKAINKKDFIAAKKLIADGIKLAEEKEHPGTVDQWNKELLRIAHLKKDTETIRRYAKHFAFDRWFDKEYYRQWKKTYSATEWKKVIDQYIEEKTKKIIKEHNKSRNKLWYTPNPPLLTSLAPVLIEEKYWDRLMALVSKEDNLDQIFEYHDHLHKKYPSELLSLYLPAFEHKARHASSRSNYVHLARIMKKVLKDIPSGKKKIMEVMARLKQQYARRPAMIDELRKAFK